MGASEPGTERRSRLAAARLYLVCPEGGASAREGSQAAGAGELPDLVREAVAGGVDVVQLREKHLPDDELVAVAKTMRALCERIGALLIVNDRPLVARQAGADGVHVGQEDMPVAEARELVGPDVLIGLSTHARERSITRTRRSRTTSPWVPCTRPRPSPGAPRWGSSSCATRPRTPAGPSSRSGGCT